MAPTRMMVRKCGSRSMIGQIACANGMAATSADARESARM